MILNYINDKEVMLFIILLYLFFSGLNTSYEEEILPLFAMFGLYTILHTGCFC